MIWLDVGTVVFDLWRFSLGGMGWRFVASIVDFGEDEGIGFKT